MKISSRRLLTLPWATWTNINAHVLRVGKLGCLGLLGKLIIFSCQEPAASSQRWAGFHLDVVRYPKFDMRLALLARLFFFLFEICNAHVLDVRVYNNFSLFALARRKHLLHAGRISRERGPSSERPAAHTQAPGVVRDVASRFEQDRQRRRRQCRTKKNRKSW